MLKIYCNEIVVKFKDMSLNTQRIRFSDGPTRAKILQVIDDGQRLLVGWVTGHEAPTDFVKIVAWPYTEVAEYCCDEILSPRMIPVVPAAEVSGT